ncbi:MAG: RNA-binding transcriptional accessory protein, partial [Desulfobulbaceae bacterium]|nr:RNA-binding transcriptional accessory protein [Desulfobulbaceae bacterium]
MDRNNNIIPHISIYIMTYTHQIANTLNLPSHSVKNTLSLLDQSATIPFIARYRKELTGSLDEVQISAIRDTVEQLKALDDRRKSILTSLEKQGILTETLQKQVASAPNLTVLEDLYLPHRPKRRTRGTIARERGLEPLAKAIFSGKPLSLNIQNFIDFEKGVNEVEDAYAGARDIIAERINEDISSRKQLRSLFFSRAVIISKSIEKNKENGQKFKDYFLWSEPVTKLAGHRFLAMLRGEKENFLSLTILPPEDTALNLLKNKYVYKAHEKPQITLAVEDGYNRLLVPSLENELKKDLKEKAELEAIEVFGA